MRLSHHARAPRGWRKPRVERCEPRAVVLDEVHKLQGLSRRPLSPCGQPARRALVVLGQRGQHCSAAHSTPPTRNGGWVCQREAASGGGRGGRPAWTADSGAVLMSRAKTHRSSTSWKRGSSPPGTAPPLRQSSITRQPSPVRGSRLCEALRVPVRPAWLRRTGGAWDGSTPMGKSVDRARAHQHTPVSPLSVIPLRRTPHRVAAQARSSARWAALASVNGRR